MPENTRIADRPRNLTEGQRLDQPTFHARYEAMPPGIRAELINGVVLMPSPVGPAHGRAHFPTIAWLSYYVENTPGIEGNDARRRHWGRSEPQPDVLLRILPEYGGDQTDRQFVQGVPGRHSPRLPTHHAICSTLARSSRTMSRAGVSEYIVQRWSPTRCFIRATGTVTS